MMSLSDDEMSRGYSHDDSEFELLSDCGLPDSSYSTSESGMSNTFLEEVLLGRYDGWTHENDRWLGRWVRDDRMKALLYSMQAFQFLDLQAFLSKPMPTPELEKFAEGTKLLDEFLANAELDIVTVNKRFPGGAYHFVDEPKWTKTFNDLYSALKYIQQPDIDMIRFYNLWIAAIVPAISENLPGYMTREKFESTHELVWTDPSFASAESDSSAAVPKPPRAALVDLE